MASDDSKKVYIKNGKFSSEKETPDYKFISTSDFFSPTTNLIPQLSGVSGNRVLLGDKASLQAISLVDRQTPLVQSKDKINNIPFVKKYAKDMSAIFATNDGEVTEVNKHKIVVGKKEYELYDNYLTGQKSFLDHVPAVKVGDKIKKGDLLATSNFTDKEGNLALGTNLTTAVMPFRSNNFEDAYVISETGAKKLVGEQMIPIRMEKQRGLDFDKDKFISLFPNVYLNAQISKIDSDGVVKKGSIVSNGDPLILAFEPRSLKTTDAQLGNISSILKNAFSDKSESWGYESPGEVVDVAKTDKLVTLTIKTRRPMSQGDKLSCGYGAKGVTVIRSDSQMPTTKDGKPVDIVLNSMSIVSRIAPSLMTSLALGKVAQKIGKPIVVDSFDQKSLLDLAQKELKNHNISEQEDVYDPVSGKHVHVTVGPLYFNRLHHISEDKVGSRGQGISYTADFQPSKSNEEESAKKIGNLATNTYLTHNARHLLEDIATIRSTRNDEYWRKLKLGEDLPPLEVPFIFKKFISHLEGAGIKVNEKGSKFNVLPQTNKDIEKISKASVENPSIFKIKAGELIPEKGGLFDPDKTGIVGENYNHINLQNEILNPITEEYIKKVLGLTSNKFDVLIQQGKLTDEVRKINVDKKISELETHLKSKRKTDRNNALKALLFLKNLKNNNITPSDLILNKIPVIPSIYRPLVFQNGKVISSGINELYRDVMLINHKVDDLPSWMHPEDIRMKQYNAVKAVYGLGAPVSVKNEQKGFKGLLASALGLQGGSAKESMFQSKVVNKPIDLVSRAVLVPDSNLDLDYISVPQSAVWKMYTPFIIKRLVESGLPATYAKEYVDNKHPLALEQLSAELKERPGLMSRDPQLNPKYSHMGYYIKMNTDPKDTTLKVNPMVFKQLGADCDGDMLNINVPVSLNALNEVKEKMLPSKNLVVPRNLSSPAFIPPNESALGLYLATTEDKKNKPKEFNSVAEMKKAFNDGEVGLGDRVTIKGSK